MIVIHIQCSLFWLGVSGRDSRQKLQ